ncbi:MAG: hypothetical protein ACRDLA_08310 [Thermoleophilaceae bacterium]
MTDLFDPDGPESRNLHAEAFEDQLVDMGPGAVPGAGEKLRA